ncbi:MAG: endonuclease/exonuclease/phosphatase family protein [Sedimenticola sp.]
MNIQSLKPKLDLLAIESQPYDVLIFTETWLSTDTSNDDLLIPNFNPPLRKDRQGRLGGGVAIYIREGLHATHRPDLSINGLESLWVDVKFNQRTFIMGGIYRPPDANNNDWLLLEECIDRVFNQACENVIIAGDFNINVHNSNSNKISRLVSSYNAEQLITTPTHFTEHSCSLIDLIIVKDTRHIISSFVADPFIPDLVRFHCPVVVVLKLNKPKATAYKRKEKYGYTNKPTMMDLELNLILSTGMKYSITII